MGGQKIGDTWYRVDSSFKTKGAALNYAMSKRRRGYFARTLKERAMIDGKLRYVYNVYTKRRDLPKSEY